MNPAIARSDFTIERRFPASPERVFAAWADPATKARWTDCRPTPGRRHSLDFRPGGMETSTVEAEDGTVFRYSAWYADIVPHARIVYAYEISVNGRAVSASLVTVEFAPHGEGAHMRFTEHVAFFDGCDGLAERIEGTNEGFDRLALEVEAPIARG